MNRNKMYKNEFIIKPALKTDLSDEEAEQFTDAFLDILTESWSKNIPVCFKGFGTFSICPTSERLARNPKTMEDVMIPAGYKPIFKASKKLRISVNEIILSSERSS